MNKKQLGDDLKGIAVISGVMSFGALLGKGILFIIDKISKK